MRAERRYSEYRQEAQPSRLDVDLLWEKLQYFGKAVSIECLDSWSNRSDGQEKLSNTRLEPESLLV
jgi:hypothetical protein